MEVMKPCSQVIPELEFLTTFLQNKGSSNHQQRFQRNASSGRISFNSFEFMSLKISSPRIRQCEAMTSSDHELGRFHPRKEDEEEEEEDSIQDKNTRDELQQFVAREASLSEEYHGAAWLRADVHFEDQPNLRHLNTFKGQFAEQEYTAITRRSKMQLGHKYMCIIMVRNEEKNGKQTLREGLVGTVDVYIGKLLHGETLPPESIETDIFQFVEKPDSIRYSYVANLCVAKPARRQGVASTMLRLAIEHSKADGVDRVYVHVDKSNKSALKLYKQLGFQVVEEANLQLEKKQIYLLCLEA